MNTIFQWGNYVITMIILQMIIVNSLQMSILDVELPKVQL